MEVVVLLLYAISLAYCLILSGVIIVRSAIELDMCEEWIERHVNKNKQHKDNSD